MSSITINTVQGIGDLIWVYRKLSPYYDTINFNVLCIDDSPVQKRAEPFLNTLDKTGDVNYLVVKNREYSRVAQLTPSLPTKSLCDYAVNRWLEEGVHLDDIDKGSKVDWDINLKLEEVKLPEKYLLVYVSGSNHGFGFYQMATKDWAKLILETAKAKGLKEVIITGAGFDRDKMLEINYAINQNIRVFVEFDYNIKQSSYLIKHASYFISYQSGLCMIAEELGTPTFMVWFPKLRAMRDTWIRKDRVSLFSHGYFDEPVESMIKTAKEHHERASDLV